MYTQIDQEILFLEDIGKTILVETEKVDEKTGEVMKVAIHQPIYEKKEVYKLNEFVSNIIHDLNNAQGEIDKADSDKVKAIERYNVLASKILEIKKDLPDIGLPNVQLKLVE